MNKKIGVYLASLFIFAFLVSGCGGGRGDGFVGRWTGKNNERMFKPTYVMTIVKDGESFHIDIATTRDALGYGKPTTNTQKFEAKAESDTVLSMLNGLAIMRLEGEIISFDGTTFIKSS